uniref:SCP domain-containing protein n=1 Tax=Heterosigma akashiwo TaxID=2829 RepID=A0A7S3XLP7_HETAK
MYRGNPMRKRKRKNLILIFAALVCQNDLLILGALFTNTIKGKTLSLYNHVRRSVRPMAANMEQLSWDKELELVSQNIASKCSWRRFPELIENIDEVDHPRVSVNYFLSGADISDENLIMDAIMSWSSEYYDNFDKDKNSCEEGRTCAHAEPIFISSTNSVGCGYAKCGSLQPWCSNYGGCKLFVCAHGGRTLDHTGTLFTEGASCSLCPKHSPYCENGLCVSSDLTTSFFVEVEEDLRIFEQESAKKTVVFLQLDSLGIIKAYTTAGTLYNPFGGSGTVNQLAMALGIILVAGCCFCIVIIRTRFKVVRKKRRKLDEEIKPLMKRSLSAHDQKQIEYWW